MTNTLQKTIKALAEGTENTIKIDVLSWLEGSEAETLEDAINLLQNVKCESRDVSHLVYSVDCGAYVYDNEEAIIEIINEYLTYGAEDLEDLGWEQHNELSCYIKWESGDDRMSRFNEEHWDEAEETAQDDNEDWDSLDEDEQAEVVREVLDDMFYSWGDPLGLDSSDKVTLAWLAFEQHAWDLSEELEGIKKVIEGE